MVGSEACKLEAATPILSDANAADPHLWTDSPSRSLTKTTISLKALEP